MLKPGRVATSRASSRGVSISFSIPSSSDPGVAEVRRPSDSVSMQITLSCLTLSARLCNSRSAT